jgi:disulfide bond formation protein DsbB
MISKNKKLVLNGILIFSILSLSIAYFIEFALEHKPCNLCIIERYPYLGTIILISLLMVVNKFEKIIYYIILSLFVFGVIVSFYHVGIEQGFFNESFVCELGNSEKNFSKKDLLKQLGAVAPVSCKNVTFKLLGLSLATINTIISIILSVIIGTIIFNYDKNK